MPPSLCGWSVKRTIGDNARGHGVGIGAGAHARAKHAVDAAVLPGEASVRPGVSTVDTAALVAPGGAADGAVLVRTFDSVDAAAYRACYFIYNSNKCIIL